MSTRRRAIVGGLSTALFAIAGCLSRSDEGGTDEPHPTVGESFPTLGPEPEAAEATVVAFEDPSCDSCSVFADQTFPRLRSLAEEDRLAYRWCGLPWVEPWSGPALQALFEVHDRDPDAFWELKGHYYDAQDRLDTDSVREYTGETLSEIGVDPDPVDSAIAERAHVDRVEGHERLAEDSEIEQVPSFALFADGEFVSTVVGAQPYDVFEGALEL